MAILFIVVAASALVCGYKARKMAPPQVSYKLRCSLLAALVTGFFCGSTHHFFNEAANLESIAYGLFTGVAFVGLFLFCFNVAFRYEQ